MMFQN